MLLTLCLNFSNSKIEGLGYWKWNCAGVINPYTSSAWYAIRGLHYVTLAHHELFQDCLILLTSSQRHNFKISYTKDNLKLRVSSFHVCCRTVLSAVCIYRFATTPSRHKCTVQKLEDTWFMLLNFSFDYFSIVFPYGFSMWIFPIYLQVEYHTRTYHTYWECVFHGTLILADHL